MPTKTHPETGEILSPIRRRDGSAAESAYVWQSRDGLITLDPTPDEDNEIHQWFDRDKSITGN